MGSLCLEKIGVHHVGVTGTCVFAGFSVALFSEACTPKHDPVGSACAHSTARWLMTSAGEARLAEEAAGLATAAIGNEPESEK